MKEKKQLMVMTSFGPVPFDAVREHLPKEIVEVIDSTKDEILAAIESAVPVCVWATTLQASHRKQDGNLKKWQVISPTSTTSILLLHSMLLREVAIELDKKYEDHINNCKELYIISSMDGRIHKVPRAYIKNFRNFAAFRTKEDAKTACRILRSELKEMFKSGRK